MGKVCVDHAFVLEQLVGKYREEKGVVCSIYELGKGMHMIKYVDRNYGSYHMSKRFENTWLQGM